MDPAFLDSDEARPVRILSEYLEPLRRLKEQNIQDTVVFFGSARVHSRQQARTALERLQKKTRRRSREYSEALKRSRWPTAWRNGAARSSRRGTASWSARAAAPASWRRPTAARTRRAARAWAS